MSAETQAKSLVEQLTAANERARQLGLTAAEANRTLQTVTVSTHGVEFNREPRHQHNMDDRQWQEVYDTWQPRICPHCGSAILPG